MQNNQEENQSQILPHGQESYANLTSQQQLPRQELNENVPPVVNSQNPPQPRQSSRVKYQRMKFTLQQYQNFIKNSLQKSITCPISLQPMTDPVIASSGRTFQRRDILNHFRVNEKTCPETRKLITERLIQNYSIKSLCQQYEELLKKLNDQQGLKRRQNKKNRITIDQYQKECAYLNIDKNKRRLDHSFKKVQMSKFINVNWTFFHEINLHSCEIDDTSMQMFLQNGKGPFKNVVELNVESNKFTTIKKLQRLPMLRRLYVGGNKYLTQDTIDYLQHINESQALRNEKRKIKVYFKIQLLQ